MTNEAGAFQNGTTAFVTESLARRLSQEKNWKVWTPKGELTSNRALTNVLSQKELDLEKRKPQVISFKKDKS